MASNAQRRVLIVGIANQHSIAYGCARAFARSGGRLAITYLNAKAEPHVRPLAEALEAEIVVPLDVQSPEQSAALFARIADQWGALDVLLHSIAYCPLEDLHGRVVDCSREGFLTAMDVSVHSFLRMVRACEPLMRDGGVCLTVSYHGSARAVEHYGIMGPVKAALESSVRYLARELGPRRIRVHALSPGPIATRAASGIEQFETLMRRAAERSPLPDEPDIEDVGNMAAFLASDEARHLTGAVHYIDSGYHVVD